MSHQNNVVNRRSTNLKNVGVASNRQGTRKASPSSPSSSSRIKARGSAIHIKKEGNNHSNDSSSSSRFKHRGSPINKFGRRRRPSPTSLSSRFNERGSTLCGRDQLENQNNNDSRGSQDQSDNKKSRKSNSRSYRRRSHRRHSSSSSSSSIPCTISCHGKLISQAAVADDAVVAEAARFVPPVYVPCVQKHVKREKCPESSSSVIVCPEICPIESPESIDFLTCSSGNEESPASAALASEAGSQPEIPLDSINTNQCPSKSCPSSSCPSSSSSCSSSSSSSSSSTCRKHNKKSCNKCCNQKKYTKDNKEKKVKKTKEDKNKIIVNRHPKCPVSSASSSICSSITAVKSPCSKSFITCSSGNQTSVASNAAAVASDNGSQPAIPVPYY